MSTDQHAPGRRRGSARSRILEAAAQRVYAAGTTATGIDAVTASAGVARMSLYDDLGSKAALVEACVETRHQEWLRLHRARAADTGTAQERVLAVFDAYADHAAAADDHGFRGCGLLNAAAELSVDDPARTAVRRHEEQVEQLLVASLGEVTDPATAQRLAEHLSFLLEGSMARAGLEGEPELLLRARAFAADMLAAL